MSDDQKSNGADVAVEVAGQKLNLKNVKSLNTLATVATLILVVLLVYAFWEHKIDAQAGGVAQNSALTNLVQAVREGNCINSYPESERENKIEFCKRITR